MDKGRRRPRASFLFAGPPGVGKTFLAETAAEAEERIRRVLGMSTEDYMREYGPALLPPLISESLSVRELNAAIMSQF